MDTNWLSYKQIFTTILIIAYLLGNFSFPLFESIHFLIHLGDNTNPHSLQSHSSNHDHQVLLSLTDLYDGDTPLAPNKNSKQKNKVQLTQYLVTINLLDFEDHFLKKRLFSLAISPYSHPFLSKDTPPPITFNPFQYLHLNKFKSTT